MIIAVTILIITLITSLVYFQRMLNKITADLGTMRAKVKMLVDGIDELAKDAS
jgi:hypothetical protein